MDDLISRQAAIDAFDCINGVEEVLKNLPSANAEYVRDCRNCKYGKYNDHWETSFCYSQDKCNNFDMWERRTGRKERR